MEEGIRVGGRAATKPELLVRKGESPQTQQDWEGMGVSESSEAGLPSGVLCGKAHVLRPYCPI